MRVGIVGGGISGLACAWALEGQHEVTLFERDGRLGGHAHTLELPLAATAPPHAAGSGALVEAGFEFYSAGLWPIFIRLLERLGVQQRDYACRITLYRKGSPHASVLQPMDLAGRLSPWRLTPGRLRNLTQLGLVLASAAPLMRARDTSRTVGQVLSRAPITSRCREEFLVPFFQSGWCVERERLLELAAYDVLRYSYMGISRRGVTPMREVVGGMRAYVAALVAQMPGATLRPHAAIEAVERDDAGFRLRERDGREHRFDHLVLAVNASDAAALLREVHGAERARALLERIEHFPTRIAIHGDARAMPADRRDWSIVNIRHDDRHAHTTVWKPWRAEGVFRSWVTYEPELPSHIHEVVDFQHVAPTPDYFCIQRELASYQGCDGLWLAGMHMLDIDSHESALLSGLHVAARLCPSAPRLALLGDSSPRGAQGQETSAQAPLPKSTKGPLVSF